MSAYIIRLSKLLSLLVRKEFDESVLMNSEAEMEYKLSVLRAVAVIIYKVHD